MNKLATKSLVHSRNSSKVAATGILAGSAMALYMIRSAVRRARKIDFVDKVVLITGGSRGLGLLLASELLRREAKVLICARNLAQLKAAQDWLHKTTGKTVHIYQCDVSDRNEVQQTVAKIKSSYGAIDILINNAGIIQVAPLEQVTYSDFEQALATSAFGSLNLILELIPNLKQRRGRIVNITSIGGRVSIPHLLPYSVAKFATTGLSLGLRAELAKDGVSVTTIIPWLMRTGSFDHALFKDKASREYTWFSISSSLPLITISAKRAVHQIIDALEHGDAVRHIGLPAWFLGTFAGIFPGLSANTLALVNRMLPNPNVSSSTASSKSVEGEKLSPQSKLFSLVTALGQQAKFRYQHPSLSQ